VVVRHLGDHPLPAGCAVLDLGTGSGALAVAAARTAGRVVAVDVNPEAVRCARLNLLLNRVDDRCEVRHGDLFDAVAGERFDRVLCNPPFYRGSPGSDLDRAFHADDFAERFAAALPQHLTEHGYALVVLSSDGDLAGFRAAFRSASLSAEIVTSERTFGEQIQLFRVGREDHALPGLS